MGISQWKAYGKKYGYWKYFLEKWLPDMFKITRIDIVMDDDEFKNGSNYCRDQFISNAKEDNVNL